MHLSILLLSRSTYNRLRDDYQLPSVSTLTRLTSKVGNMDDLSFIREVICNLEERQRNCILMVDEIYVKATLSYHGGRVFGRAQNKPEKLAKTVLGVMLKCLFGGPVFLIKMMPVRDLTADFQFQEVSLIMNNLQNGGAHVVSIICDGNRTNPAFFKMFDTNEDSPWVTKDGKLFLLYDYVHLIKSLRNNWLTERCGELLFDDKGHSFIAKWSDLLDLYKLEQDEEHSKLLKMSKLKEVSVYPKPIERQRVSTCLNIFCDETIAALENHPKLQNADNGGTVLFLKKIVEFWKIVNVRGCTADKRFRDPHRSVITSNDDIRFHTLSKLANTAIQMKGTVKARKKSLTVDTSKSFAHSHGLIALTNYLLETTHDFVMLGEFSSDPLEKAFGKLRQGSGGTYFITSQQISEKHNIMKTKLLLKLDPHMFHEKCSYVGHSCTLCNFKLSEEMLEIIDNLPVEENVIPDDEKLSLVYIAGYVSRKDDDGIEETYFYYEKYGSYSHTLDRGGLKKPNDSICQWVFFSYVIFNSVKTQVCRKSLSGIFDYIASSYSLKIEDYHCNTLANIFLNNYCKQITPRSGKESAQKVIKLS